MRLSCNKADGRDKGARLTISQRKLAVIGRLEGSIRVDAMTAAPSCARIVARGVVRSSWGRDKAEHAHF
jgi:hypothetical protein